MKWYGTTFQKTTDVWNLAGPARTHMLWQNVTQPEVKKNRSNFKVGKIIFRYGFVVTFKKYETCPIHVNIY